MASAPVSLASVAPLFFVMIQPPVSTATPTMHYSEKRSLIYNTLIFRTFFAIGLDARSPNDMEKEREKGRFSGQNVRFGVRASLIGRRLAARRERWKILLFLAVIRLKRQ